jgi:hypothetical protein
MHRVVDSLSIQTERDDKRFLWSVYFPADLP